MYVLLDLDHTIANSFWRDSMIGIEPWDVYHEASKDDKPFKKIVRLVNSLAAMSYVVVGVTGRNEKFRQLTTKWLLSNQIDVDELLMRPDNDFSKNGEMKIKLINDHFKGDYSKIQFLIDDNEETILAFSKLGITTLQVRNINEVKNGYDRTSRQASGTAGTDNGAGNIPVSNGDNEEEQRNL